MTTRRKRSQSQSPQKEEPVSRIYKKGNFEVYLGKKEVACDQEWINDHKIDIIINAMDTKICEYPDHIQYMFLDMYDGQDIHRTPKRRQHSDAKLNQIFEAAAQKIEEARRNGKRVFVHCRLGQSRSATVVWYWLTKYVNNMDANTAMSSLQAARPEVNPNSYFRDRIIQTFESPTAAPTTSASASASAKAPTATKAKAPTATKAKAKASTSANARRTSRRRRLSSGQ